MGNRPTNANLPYGKAKQISVKVADLSPKNMFGNKPLQMVPSQIYNLHCVSLKFLQHVGLCRGFVVVMLLGANKQKALLLVGGGFKYF